jgi:hypothetical protein
MTITYLASLSLPLSTTYSMVMSSEDSFHYDYISRIFFVKDQLMYDASKCCLYV